MKLKEIEEIIYKRKETYTINKKTDIWLIPYTSYHDNEPACDIADNLQDLYELIEQHERFNDNYRVIKLEALLND